MNNGVTRGLRGDALSLDFVTALSVEDCVHYLRRSASQRHDRPLTVRQAGRRLWVEIGWRAAGMSTTPGLWWVRFEGELTPVSVGTRVHGRMVRNTVLEMVLVLPGLMTASFVLLGIALAVPFVAVLSMILLVLFMVYYTCFQRLLARQGRDVLRWVYARLTIPEGRAGGSLR